MTAVIAYLAQLECHRPAAAGAAVAAAEGRRSMFPPGQSSRSGGAPQPPPPPRLHGPVLSRESAAMPATRRIPPT